MWLRATGGGAAKAVVSYACSAHSQSPARGNACIPPPNGPDLELCGAREGAIETRAQVGAIGWMLGSAIRSAGDPLLATNCSRCKALSVAGARPTNVIPS